ncbi:MAG: Polyketide biosynthesis protein PksE [Firmicutes bacterium ADurb.Bin419]|nr:MAG: Polyketide biosynthesis protein PksE [Firmicutes bacterium ADurb.Bin419]
MKKAILFAGQGAQFKGMGKNLFPIYKEQAELASNILGYSITELCLEDPEQKLGQTEYTQPAIYVVNSFEYWKYMENNGSQADFYAGHSLGEYNALHAAGAFDFETGLRLVRKRGALMAKASGGAMVAVMKCGLEEIKEILTKHRLDEVDIANYNSPSQTILSGPKESMKNVELIFKDYKILCIPLKVSAAFHSRYMSSAQAEFEKVLKEVSFLPLKTPVIANFTARPYNDADIAKLLTQQISGSVQWRDSIRYLMGKGEMEFIEIGERPVITKMVVDIKENDIPIIENDTIPEAKPGPAENKPVNNHAREELNSDQDAFGYILPEQLGNPEFKKVFGLKYSYFAGAMYRGISSKEMVVAMGKAGMMGVLGTGGMKKDEIKADIQYIQEHLSAGEAYAVNLLCNIYHPEIEMETVQVFIEKKVKRVEAAGFMQITPAIVWYHASGLYQDAQGNVQREHRIIAKLSRPEVAQVFMSPAPEAILEKLVSENRISREQADMARRIPVSEDICAEADSGGHTDQGRVTVLFPAIRNLCKEITKKFDYKTPIRIGLAGGIGTPEAAAAAFLMGADFIVTGSISQCTVEAGTSDVVKNMLQDINIQDTDYAPAGDMFEMGAKAQVLKKGVFFPARANKLYSLYTHYNSLEEIPTAIRKQIEDKYFKKSFDTVLKEIREDYIIKGKQQEIQKLEGSPKQKMALIFRSYFKYAMKVAFTGDEDKRVDFQVYTGPALGAFNQWVKGTELEAWKNRKVAQIGEKLMTETADLLNSRCKALFMCKKM